MGNDGFHTLGLAVILVGTTFSNLEALEEELSAVLTRDGNKLQPEGMDEETARKLKELLDSKTRARCAAEEAVRAALTQVLRDYSDNERHAVKLVSGYLFQRGKEARAAERAREANPG